MLPPCADSDGDGVGVFPFGRDCDDTDSSTIGDVSSPSCGANTGHGNMCALQPDGTPCLPAGAAGNGTVYAAASCQSAMCQAFTHTKCGRVIIVQAEIGSFPSFLQGAYVRNSNRTVNGRVVYVAFDAPLGMFAAPFWFILHFEVL